MQNNPGEKSMDAVSDLDQIANKVENNCIRFEFEQERFELFYKFKNKESIDLYIFQVESNIGKISFEILIFTLLKFSFHLKSTFEIDSYIYNYIIRMQKV